MEKDLENCFKVLKNGGTILYPTDTVWGIGCDATNYKAVEKVYKIKKRDKSKSMIILLDDIIKLEFYIEKVPPIAYDLIKKYTEPLTIVFQKAKNVADNVIAKDETIAIRIVRDEFCRRLLTLYNKPIVSTSANIANEAPPLTFNKITDNIRKGVDYVVEYNRGMNVASFKPSTIIKITEEGEFMIIRK